MINTFDLTVFFNGYSREYHNISRTAVKYYIQWHRENPDFYGYEQAEHGNHKIR